MNDKDIKNSTDTIRDLINFQFDISWSLLEFHFAEIEDEECFWKPGAKGLYVYNEAGIWRVDWPDSESYDCCIPPQALYVAKARTDR